MKFQKLFFNMIFNQLPLGFLNIQHVENLNILEKDVSNIYLQGLRSSVLNSGVVLFKYCIIIDH